MSKHLSTALDKALARLATGEPVEAILVDYPSQRDDLALLLLAARELAPLRNVPPPADTEAGLASFLDEARALRIETAVKPRRWHWLAKKRAALRELWWYPQTRLTFGAAVTLAFLFVLMAGTVALAADSLPGDWLYPLKLAGEEVRLSLISDPADRAARHLVRTQARAEEIRRLVQMGRPIEEATLARLNQSLETTLLNSASAEPDQIPLLLAAVEEVTMEQQALMTALEATAATAQTREMLGQVQVSLSETQSLARAGRSDVQTFRLNARLGVFQIGSPLSGLSVTRTPTPTNFPPDTPVEVPDDAGGVETVTPTVTATARPTTTPTPTESIASSPTSRPTHTPEPSRTPRPSDTPEPSFTPEPSHTLEPPGQTHTPQPPGQTRTPAPPGQTKTPKPPGQTKTPDPPGQANTPQPPGQANTPQPPGKTKPPKKP